MKRDQVEAQPEMEHSLRRLGKRRTDGGLTILEIVLASFLTFLVATSVYSIYRKKKAQAPEEECKLRKWNWSQTLEAIEWKVRKWEVLGAPCLKVGYQPIKIEEGEVFPTLWDIILTRPVVKPMTDPHFFPIGKENDFLAGTSVVICDNEKMISGTVKDVRLGGDKQFNLEIDYPELPGAPPFTPGTIVVGVKRLKYESEPTENPPERMLYEAKSKQERKPLVTGFEKFELSMFSDVNNAPTAKVAFSYKECELKDTFPLVPQPTGENFGRWWVNESNMVLQPWVITEAEALP
jgi:hypothetical protein